MTDEKDAAAEAPAAEITTPPATPRARTHTMAVIGAGLLLVFVVLLVAGVVPRVKNGRTLAAAAAEVRTAVQPLRVFRPEPAQEAALVLAGTTQAMQDAVIYARTSGYIKQRHVDIGDRVRAGQLLAEIASPEVEQMLLQARADLVQSQKNLDLQKATLELAVSTMDRYKAADKEGAVAIEAVDQSVSSYRTAQAGVAAAEANVESNRANVERLVTMTSFQRVLAPFAGTVIQRNVDAGALITAGSPTDNTAVAPTTVSGAANGLFEIAQIDVLRVFVNVPQTYAANIRPGLPVQVSVRGHLGEPVSGTVARTANAIDPATRTLLTEVDIAHGPRWLLPGMFVYVNFTIAPTGVRWRVPATALVIDAQGTRVATVDAGNVIRFRPVTLGRDFGATVDIQAGLSGHETIVTQPMVSLQEGQVVTPIDSATAR